MAGTGTQADIYTLVSNVRDLINEPRRHQILSRSPHWRAVTSGLDILTDTQEAIDSFPIVDKRNARGALYLQLYGVLQAFVLQQDAARAVTKAVGIKVKWQDYGLADVRRIRVIAAGHPTQTREDSASHFVVQGLLSPRAFSVLSVGDERQGWQDVSVQELVRDQRTGIALLLSHVLGTLKEEAHEHRMAFRTTKFGDLFPQATDYFFEKITVGASSPRDSPTFLAATASFHMIEQVLRAFQAELERRGLDAETYPGVAASLSETEYPLEQLRAFFSPDQAVERIGAEAAKIFGSYLHDQTNALRLMAAEIDREYDA